MCCPITVRVHVVLLPAGGTWPWSTCLRTTASTRHCQRNLEQPMGQKQQLQQQRQQTVQQGSRRRKQSRRRNEIRECCVTTRSSWGACCARLTACRTWDATLDNIITRMSHAIPTAQNSAIKRRSHDIMRSSQRHSKRQCIRHATPPLLHSRRRRTAHPTQHGLHPLPVRDATAAMAKQMDRATLEAIMRGITSRDRLCMSTAVEQMRCWRCATNGGHTSTPAPAQRCVNAAAFSTDATASPLLRLHASFYTHTNSQGSAAAHRRHVPDRGRQVHAPAGRRAGARGAVWRVSRGGVGCEGRDWGCV
jgi:hypothetical protein